MSNISKSRRFCLQLLRSATTIVVTLLATTWLQELSAIAEPSGVGAEKGVTPAVATATGVNAQLEAAPAQKVPSGSPAYRSEEELIQQMAGRLVRKATAVSRPSQEREIVASSANLSPVTQLATSLPLEALKSSVITSPAVANPATVRPSKLQTPLPPTIALPSTSHKMIAQQLVVQQLIPHQQQEMVFNAPPRLPSPYYYPTATYPAANYPAVANGGIAPLPIPTYAGVAPSGNLGIPYGFSNAYSGIPTNPPPPMGGPATYAYAAPQMMQPVPMQQVQMPMGYSGGYGMVPSAPPVYIPYNVTPTAGYISSAPQPMQQSVYGSYGGYQAGYAAPMPYGYAPMPMAAMPPMPSPYAGLQTPYGVPRLTPPVARMKSMPMVAQQPQYAAPSVMPQYGQPVYPQYVQPQYGQPQYAQPQYGQPQPQYGQPIYPQQYAQPQYGQPVVQPQVPVIQPIPQMGGNYGQQILANPLNAPLAVPTTKGGLPVQNTDSSALKPDDRGPFKSTALSRPSLTLQGVYQYQADDNSARARLSANYPLSPRVLFGATLDVSTGKGFSDSPNNGFNVNELFFATSLPEIPTLRFAVGQLDMTSYFDRNSFAKDGASHFFNPTFQTNNALAAAGLGSRPGLLVNWSLSDNIEAKAAAFSSSRGLSEFSLNAFAGEIGVRYGNAIFRGTYVTGRDSGNKDSFREAFSVNRGNGQVGLLKDDRESAFGLNGEVFIPKYKMGIFARYGRYNNIDAGESGDTYGAGVSFLDVFSTDDRLGVAYGSALTNERLRRQAGNRKADALEVFYDFRFMPNLRLGFSLQQRNEFSEIVAGVRVKTEFDVTPKGRLFQ